MVRQRINRARESGGCSSSSAEEWNTALRAELCQILSVLDGRCSQLAATELPQEGSERSCFPEDNVRVVCVGEETPALAPSDVRCFVVFFCLFPLLMQMHCLVQAMLASFPRGYLRLPGYRDCDRISDGPDSPVPVPSSFPDENLEAQVSQPLPMNPSIPLSPQPADADHPSELPPIPDSDRRALQHLVSGAVPQDQLASLIESIVTNVKAAAIVGCLRGTDVQKFIEVMDKVRMTSYLSDGCSMVNFCFSRP